MAKPKAIVPPMETLSTKATAAFLEMREEQYDKIRRGVEKEVISQAGDGHSIATLVVSEICYDETDRGDLIFLVAEAGLEIVSTAPDCVYVKIETGWDDPFIK